MKSHDLSSVGLILVVVLIKFLWLSLSVGVNLDDYTVKPQYNGPLI